MNEETTGEVIVTLASTERHYSYEDLGVNFNSSDDEVLDALQSFLLDDEGFNIRESQEDGLYTMKRVESSQNIYVFPKSTAGKN